MWSNYLARASAEPTEFVDQDPADLRLFVVGGPIDLEQFTILKEQAFDWLGMSVRLAIIGESHFVSLQTPDGNFCEICACTELRPDPATEILSDTMPVTMGDPLRRDLSDIGYASKTSYMADGSGKDALAIFAAESQRIAAGSPGSTMRLHLRFPRDDGSLPVPETVVLAEYADDLVVRSAHTYPPHRTIVFTESRFSPKPAWARNSTDEG